MKTALTATCFLLGTLLLPIAALAADSDTDRSSPEAFVKDSVITSKVKAKLAEERMSSAMHIRVDTDDKGVVYLTGTARNQAEVDRAGSIARGVEGVVSVKNNIRIAKAQGMAPAAVGSGEDRVETRIKEMHARLAITQTQEGQWAKVAQVMRDNAKQMDALTKTRAEKADMNAIDDLRSYGAITEAHAQSMRQFTPVFEKLYDSMSDPQKKTADNVFRHGGRMGSMSHS